MEQILLAYGIPKETVAAIMIRLVLVLEKNQGVQSQWPKENQKTLREYCNAIITKVLNIKQWSQL